MTKMAKYGLRFGLLGALVIVVYTNCSGSGMSGADGGAAQGTVPLTPLSGPNVLAVNLGGYGNEPTVSVTVCSHGSTTNCYQIDNLLLDSGSSGLRVFSNALPPSFVSSTRGECQTYIDGTIDWGPVVDVDVVMGTVRASSVPIQIIDQPFGDGGKSCYTNDVTYLQNNGFLSVGGCSYTNEANGCPQFDAPSANYSGIIGVNFLLQDCGTACSTSAANDVYYTCSGATCTSATMPLASQVSNPIGFLPSPYNNGLMIEMPATAADNNLTAYVVLGIGAGASDTPSGVTTMTADPNESDQNFTFITTQWQNQTIGSFLDTGSNTLEFPYSNTVNTVVAGYPIMPVDYNTDAFTPGQVLTFNPINVSYAGVQLTTSFTIENVEDNFGTYNVVNYIGVLDGSGPIDGEFDWGLPFFLGRTVYVGLEGASSTLGTGLYWAY